jgi:hypothetical protein
VVDLLRLYNGVVHWDLMFIHSIQDWELESFTALMDLLYAETRHGTRCRVHSLELFLGKLFKNLRSHPVLLFLFGLWHWGKS